MKKIWKKSSFEDFNKGTMGNGGQNIYVSSKGVLQRIHQYDITGNGYPDLLFANSQSMGERTPAVVYNGLSEKKTVELRTRGAFDGVMCDVTGDGHKDLIIACQHDGVLADVTSFIYFSSPEGYSEKYMTELPTSSATAVAGGDFRGTGRNDLAFAGNGRIRFFEQTDLGIEAAKFRDIAVDAISICTADIDGDGFEDLYVLTGEGKMRVYWGGTDGISADRYTEIKEKTVINKKISSSTEGRLSVFALSWNVSVVKVHDKTCIFRVENDYAAFDCFDSERNPKTILKIKAKGAVHAVGGCFSYAERNDIAVAVRNDFDKSEKSLLLLEEEDYSKEKAIEFTSRGANKLTVFPADTRGINLLLVSQLSTKRNNTVSNPVLSFLGRQPKIEKELEGMCTMKICAGDSGNGIQIVLINHESGLLSGEENIYIYTGNKNGYSPKRRIELPGLSAVEGQMIDFTDNGYPDVLLVCCAENCPKLCTGLYIYQNNGNGLDINNRVDIPCILPHGVAVGDFRHSGYLDIAVAGIRNREMRIFEGGPDGYSETRMKKIVFGPGPEEYKPYAWKEDFLDIDVFNEEESENIRNFGEMRWIFAVDINGNGYLDLIISQITGKNTIILFGGPEGFSTDRMQLLATGGVACINAADLNGNGYPDVVLGGHMALGKKLMKESYITIYWNDGHGLKENRKTCLPAWCVNSLAIGDFNNDGVLDIYGTSYSNGRVRDLDSFIYFGDKTKGFLVDNRQRIFNNSGSGCICGDFNFDGYIDLAVGNHKKEGNHVCDSYVYWGGPDGISENRKTSLPTKGVHGMTTVDIGNILDRGNDEYYYSEIYEIPEEFKLSGFDWEAENGINTNVLIQFRGADVKNKLHDAAWGKELSRTDAPDRQLSCKYLQYRLILRAKSGCGTPRVRNVKIIFEE